MIDGNGDDLLQYADGSGCWTFNFPANRRQIAEQALVDAQLMATQMVTLLTDSEAMLWGLIDEYFGPNCCIDDARMATIKQNFSNLHANVTGANRSKLFLAPPAAHMNAPGRRTIAFVLETIYTADKGAVLFLNDPFFSGVRPNSDRAGTILHEASHYHCGTVDEDETGTDVACYGVADCKLMAALDTGRSRAATLRNADTYSNFAVEATEGFGFLV